MYRALYTYAWDLIDRSPKDVAKEFQSYGINTITLATSYHAGKFIRPRSDTGKVYFPEDGTVYFQANPDRYGQLKPQLNSILQQQDVLADFCQQDEIAVNGWTVLLHNTRLGLRHPETTVLNAFGDSSVYSLCPVNPLVREYAIALCVDLTESYALSGLSLETPGFLPFVHGYHHEFAQIEQNDWLNFGFAICFCGHCKDGAQQHGIDISGLQRRLVENINSYLASPYTVSEDMAKQWLLADFVSDPEWGTFLRWRCDQVTSLVGEIRNEIRADVTLAVIPTVQRPSCATWLEGSDLMALVEIVDWLEVPFYENSPERVASDAWDVCRRVGGASKLRGILRPGPPDMNSQEQLSASITVLQQQGINELAFYNYGMLRQHNLDWLGTVLS